MVASHPVFFAPKVLMRSVMEQVVSSIIYVNYIFGKSIWYEDLEYDRILGNYSSLNIVK